MIGQIMSWVPYICFPYISSFRWATTKKKFLFVWKRNRPTYNRSDLYSYSHCPDIVTMLHIHLSIQSVLKIIYPKQ